MKLRQLAFTLHRYVGIMVGILLVIIGLTGSSLVFWHQIDRSLNPQLSFVVPQGDRIPLQSALDTSLKAYPDLMLGYIELPKKPDASYKIGMTSTNGNYFFVYINPYTGELLGKQQWGRTLMTFLYDLHITLLAGETGGLVVGSCGLLLLLLGITGIILLPTWKNLNLSLKIRWQAPSHLINYDIHRTGGIVSVIFLILIAFTGTAMIFYSHFEPGVYWLTGTQKLSEPTSTVVDKSPMAVDIILQKAEAALPGGEITFISLPQKPDGVVKVAKKLPQEVIHPNGNSEVALDQYSGKVLLVKNAFKVSLAERILNLLFPLHIGVYGGLIMQIVYVFIGLTPALLFITGIALWRRRQWNFARRQEAIRQSNGFIAEPQEFSPLAEWPWF
ncbi:PepSY-associated TM helix domain-containing protein [Kamptonema animale CS-326]|jgi:uncharacterized iron-regulated membrane protein|uniref:PepSY-associated TM helix domain-containing protein n=1 Tax=Kamptonema animale TaxID=92934 RepID=UPI00232F1B6F|nr:PepSY-associated TM helix domain-containing protein [Kamptonema animale]MDB9510665.1 PepSY-associated TM helix domain-containing protein [Kamptonema animale CS-326]